MEQPLHPVPRDPIWIPPAIFGLLSAYRNPSFKNVYFCTDWLHANISLQDIQKNSWNLG